MLWWLSFAKDDGVTSYVCIVEAGSFLEAHFRATAAGINPGGEVLGFPIPDEADEAKLPRNRLLTEQELRAVGAKKQYEVDGSN